MLGLNAGSSKCAFGKVRLVYLGHKIGSGTISIPERRVEALRNYPRPATRKSLKSFLGLASYFRWYVRNFAAIAAIAAEFTPLTAASACNTVEWTSERDSLFRELLSFLCSNVFLFFPLSEGRIYS